MSEQESSLDTLLRELSSIEPMMVRRLKLSNGTVLIVVRKETFDYILAQSDMQLLNETSQHNQAG